MFLKNTNGTGLELDLYQLTMGQTIFNSRMHKIRTSFSMFYRKPPYHGTHVIACGINSAIDFIHSFRFSKRQIKFLAALNLDGSNQKMFTKPYLNYLSRLKFSGNVQAVQEGTSVSPYCPMIQIQAPVIEAMLVESRILNIVNFESLIATHAAMLCNAANGKDVFDFGFRRAQGLEASCLASRAAYIGGCVGTSNVEAAFRYGLNPVGTHAHSYIMFMGAERLAFESFYRSYPDNSVFLVDTHDIKTGIQTAIDEAIKMHNAGHPLRGIRIDSGDIDSIRANIKFAREEMKKAKIPMIDILVSGDLDIEKITELENSNTDEQPTKYCVGSNLLTGGSDPFLSGVYKLNAIDATRNLNKKPSWIMKRKESEHDLNKQTLAGPHNFVRIIARNKTTGDNEFVAHMIMLEDEVNIDQFALQESVKKILQRDDIFISFPKLKNVIVNGKIFGNLTRDIYGIRIYAKEDFRSLNVGLSSADVIITDVYKLPMAKNKPWANTVLLSDKMRVLMRGGYSDDKI